MTRPDDDIDREAAAIRARAEAERAIERQTGRPVRLDWVTDPEAPVNPQVQAADDALYRRAPSPPISVEAIAGGQALAIAIEAERETVALIARLKSRRAR